MAGLSKQLLLTFLRNKLIFMICFSILVIGIVMMWDLPKKFPNVVGLIYICVWNYDLPPIKVLKNKLVYFKRGVANETKPIQ